MSMMQAHLRRMARYNRWANQRLYDAASGLSEADYLAPRKAFFDSIHGTLNHLLIADWVWRARIEGKDNPAVKLNDRPFADLISLRAEREAEDQRLIALTERYEEAELAGDLVYRMITLPGEIRTPLHICWLHLFNHQTHHRGQVHGMLSQTEIPPPPLDLIFYLREADGAR
jgi:uncharacterized damage-inducible protein DinB